MARRVPIEALLLLAILLLGGVLRGIYLQEICRLPEFVHPEVDAGYQDAWARALVSGDWSPQPHHDVSDIPRRPYFRPPGYPFFLAAVYRACGPDYLAARVVQMGLGLVNVLLAFALGRRLFGPAVALTLAAGMAGYWGFLYFEGELLEPVLLVTLSLLLTLLLARFAARCGRGWAAAAGLTVGLAALVRPNFLLFGLAVPLWMLGLARARRGAWRAAWLPVLLYAAGAAAAILPVTVRNLRAGGEPVLISANGGVNLYIGNNEQADGLFVARVMESSDMGTSDVYPKLVAKLEREQGRALSYREVSAFFSARARQFIRAHPRRFLELLGRKTLLFFGAMETGHNRSIYYDRHFSPLLHALPGNFAVVLALALTGAAMAGLTAATRGRWAGWTLRTGPDTRAVLALCLLFVGVYAASFLPFFVTAQYRVPVLPFLLLGAAAALVNEWNLVRLRRREPAAAGLLAALALVALCAVNYTRFEPNLAKWYFDRGVGYAKSGDRAAAERAYQAAIRAEPACADAYMNWGLLLDERGESAAAERLLRAAVALQPRQPKARNNLANNLARQGRLDEAEAEYRASLALDPDAPGACKNLATILLALGRPAEAVPWLERALRLAPNSPLARAHLEHARQLAAPASNSPRR